jgi:MFS family permease
MPLALTLLNAAFPPEHRGWALGVYGGVTGLAATLGPVIGGIVTQGLDWPWIFWLNVPIGLVAIPLVRSRVPYAAPAPTRLDLPGLVLAGLAAFGLVFGLIRGSVLSGVVAVVALVAFVLVSRRVAAPMLPPRLFASRGFAAGNAAILLINAGLTGALFLIAQWLQVVGGQGPLGAGLGLLPIGLVPVVLGPRAGALADRFGSQRLVAAGGVAMAIGLGWFALSADAGAGAGAGFLVVLVLSLGLVGLGLTLAVPACTRAVVSRVAPADMAKASGTFSTLRQLGGAFGVAVLGAVLTPAGLAGGVRAALLVAAGLALAGGMAGALLPSARTAVPAGATGAGGSRGAGRPERVPGAA